MKSIFNISSLSTGIIVTIIFSAMSLIQLPVIESLERKFYDFAMIFSTKNQNLSQDIVLVTIDDKSIESLGTWPWSLDKFSTTIDYVSKSNAKLIGFNLIFNEKKEQSALREINQIISTFRTSLEETKEVNLKALLKYLEEASVRLDNEKQFIESIKSLNNVVLPVYFKLNLFSKLDSQPEALKFLEKCAINANKTSNKSINAGSAIMPFYELAEAAKNFGHINLQYDVDQKLRNEILFIKYQDKFYPSYPLKLFMKFNNIEPDKIKIMPQKGIYIKDSFIPTDEQYKVQLKLFSIKTPVFSFYDVYNGHIPKSVFKDKIVIICSCNSKQLLSYSQKGLNEAFHNINVFENLIKNSMIKIPDWSLYAQIGAACIFLVFLSIIMPLIGIYTASIIFILLFGLWFSTCMYFLINNDFWIKWIYPALQLFSGFVFIFPGYFAKKVEKKPDRNKINEPEFMRYDLDEAIGRGSIGIVYKGKDHVDEQKLAIKTFYLKETCSPDLKKIIKKNFMNELETISRLSHPNIVKIYDFGVDDDFCYIVMDILEENALEKYYSPYNLLPLRKVLQYMIIICDTLDYAHKNWVVHGSLKPSNIFVNRDSEVKILDFGLSFLPVPCFKQVSPTVQIPVYMSPEQIEAKKIDGRSDIFSLGIIFYQLLTGNLPFTGDTFSQLSYNITKNNHPAPKEFNSKLPVACEQILDIALDKDINKRYQTAEAFAKHLRILLQKIEETIAKKK